MIISPIFYMGNKKKLIQKGLIDLFPKDIDCFIDVFAGSSVVSMNVKANQYYINDNDKNLKQLYELFKSYESDSIINHINSRIDEYGLVRERTKRNEFKDKEKIKQYKSAYMRFRDYYNMCIACEIKNGERTEILDNSATDYKIYIENVANIFRLHMTNGKHHTTRNICYCPFCGRKLINK